MQGPLPLQKFKRSICAGALACLSFGAAHAAPEVGHAAAGNGSVKAAASAGSTDAVLQLLYEKGLVPAAAAVQAGSNAMRQARDAAADLVLSAMNLLGVPYRRGGSSDDGFDCSGFTWHIFESSIGLVLPHRADQQARDQNLQTVARDELQPGDLVFFNTMKRAFSHVGIYLGDGKFIHAPRTGSQVRIEDMRAAYWTKRFNGARRAELVAAGPDTQLRP